MGTNTDWLTDSTNVSTKQQMVTMRHSGLIILFKGCVYIVANIYNNFRHRLVSNVTIVQSYGITPGQAHAFLTRHYSFVFAQLSCNVRLRFTEYYVIQFATCFCMCSETIASVYFWPWPVICHSVLRVVGRSSVNEFTTGQCISSVHFSTIDSSHCCSHLQGMLNFRLSKLNF